MSGGRFGHHELRVARIVQETADARSFVLEIPPSLRDRFAYAAGQFLTFQVTIDGTHLARCYSLCSAPVCDAELQFTVKRVAGGRVSNWFHDAIAEGDVLHVLPPTGGFLLQSESQRPLVLFGGGSGITPLLSILKTALATSARRVKLVYANRDADSIIFRDALAALAARHPERFALAHHLDRERGFLDDVGVRAAIAGFEDAEFYLCGPGPFMALVERVLHEAGVANERIFIERFEVAEAAPLVEEPGSSAAALRVHLDGRTRDVPCAPGETILQAARRAGLNPPSACEDGYCGCCMATLLQGEVEMAQCHALDDDDRAQGLILTCQARPKSRACEVRWD